MHPHEGAPPIDIPGPNIAAVNGFRMSGVEVEMCAPDAGCRDAGSVVGAVVA